MTELQRRLVSRYNPGQFTFRNFDNTASNEQLYDLAVQMNSFQTCDLYKVLRVRTFEF